MAVAAASQNSVSGCSRDSDLNVRDFILDHGPYEEAIRRTSCALNKFDASKATRGRAFWAATSARDYVSRLPKNVYLLKFFFSQSSSFCTVRRSILNNVLIAEIRAMSSAKSTVRDGS